MTMEKAKTTLDTLFKIAISPNHPKQAKAVKQINELWDILIGSILRPPKKEEPWSVS